MRNISVISYLISLLSLGLGYSKMQVYMNALTNQVNTYDSTMDLSLAISFLVVTIFFAVVGFASYTLRSIRMNESPMLRPELEEDLAVKPLASAMGI
ncbi:MAG TPA: hypothetical protein VIM51_12095 [Desulfosporosinus sp.]